MSNIAILIAVEHYSGTRISPVNFAEADAKELSKAFESLDVPQANQVILLSSQATKATVESRIRKTLKGMVQGDALYLYYAGHGFAKNAENFITCHDTNIDDLVGTSIAVQWTFSELKNSRCQKVAMFLDSCESGMLASSDIRGIYTDMTEDELHAFFSAAEHRVCFAACKPGEESHSSGRLKHGIWTYHLIETLKGEAPKAIECKSLITSSSLQNYLAIAVPRTIRETYTTKKTQTPWLYGAQSRDFLVADIASLLQSKKLRSMPGAKQLKRVRIYGETLGEVRTLSGFKRGRHRVPDEANEATENFVRRIASSEIEKDLESVFQQLREAFGFKRNELKTDSSDQGETIITPFFNYDVSVSLNPDDASEYVLRREVSNIREPNQVFSDEFAMAFPDAFDTLEFESKGAIAISDIIDHIESIDDDSISVTYDKDVTYCKIELEGSDLMIHVSQGSFCLSLPRVSSPKLLIESFFEVQKKLVDHHSLKQLPFTPEQPT